MISTKREIELERNKAEAALRNIANAKASTADQLRAQAEHALGWDQRTPPDAEAERILKSAAGG